MVLIIGSVPNDIPIFQIPQGCIMRELNTILSKATANVGGMYFHLNIDGGDAPIFRERAYCYELYHQMRLLWPKMTEYFLNGEFNKLTIPLRVIKRYLNIVSKTSKNSLAVNN